MPVTTMAFGYSTLSSAPRSHRAPGADRWSSSPARRASLARRSHSRSPLGPPPPPARCKRAAASGPALARRARCGARM
eukprot:scaffold960_cov239-Prasinococcus_capsulatus_cf.AAC.2